MITGYFAAACILRLMPRVTLYSREQIARVAESLKLEFDDAAKSQRQRESEDDKE